jgi:predicted transcriptional regulator
MRKKVVKSNPFISSLQVKCKWDVKVTLETGYGQVARSIPVEVDHRVSVYTEHLVSLVLSLDKGSLRLLAYICEHLRWGQDYLQLDVDKVCEALDMSRASYYRAVDMLDTKVIVKREASNSTYFINPMYIYCGKRHVDFKENIVFVNKNPLDNVFSDPVLPQVGEAVPAITEIPGTGWTRPPHVAEPTSR